MAAIHDLITLGIGTPGGVPQFLTFGLGSATSVTISPTADYVIRVRADDVVVRVMADAVVLRVLEDEVVVMV